MPLDLSGQTLQPPVTTTRSILHTDMDAFFASVEQLDEPQRQKQRQVDSALDRIVERFGDRAIKRGG